MVQLSYMDKLVSPVKLHVTPICGIHVCIRIILVNNSHDNAA